ncbi:unnamed protein product [Jaminaea pallidilutea]
MTSILLPSPRAVTGPHISWVLLTIYWSRSQCASKILDIGVGSPLADVKLSSRLLVYLLRCWDGVSPPPGDLEELCDTLVMALLPAGPVQNQEQRFPSRLHSMRRRQVDSIITWLNKQWQMLIGDGGGATSMAHSVDKVVPNLSIHLVRIVDMAAECFSEEPGAENTMERDALEQRIDRRSPLGFPIRRLRMAVESMDEMKDMPGLAHSLMAWQRSPVGSSSGAKAGTSYRSSLSGDGLARLPERMEVFARYQHARRRGDYTASKDLMMQFFAYAPPVPHPSSSAAPNPTMASVASLSSAGQARTKLHHHAMLNLAGFYVEWEQWMAASQSLKEATQLCKAERDVAALEMCQSLARRVEAGSASHHKLEFELVLRKPTLTWMLPSRKSNNPSPNDGPKNSRTAGAAESVTVHKITSDDLWDALRCSRHGYYSLAQIVEELTTHLGSVFSADLVKSATSTAAAQSSKNAPAAPTTGEPPANTIARDCPRPWATLATLHAKMGNIAQARTYRSVARQEAYQGNEDWQDDDELTMRCQEAFEMAEAGEYQAALLTLMERSLLEQMTLRRFRRWQAFIWRVLHLHRRRSGDVMTCYTLARKAVGKSSFNDDRWDADDAEDERSIDAALSRQMQHMTSMVETANGLQTLERLFNNLIHARDLGRKIVHRRILILIAQVQSFHLQQEDEALEDVEEWLPGALADHNVERKGEACWVYALLLLARTKKGFARVQNKKATPWDAMSCREVIHWIHQARDNFSIASPFHPKLPVLYYHLAQLHGHLGEAEARSHWLAEADRVERCLQERKYLGGSYEEALELETWERVVQRIGDEVSSR